MKALLLLSLKAISFCAWIIFDQVMRMISSPKSIITAESMNNRKEYQHESVNERNAQFLNEKLKEI
jgi:hypothetical protein